MNKNIKINIKCDHSFYDDPNNYSKIDKRRELINDYIQTNILEKNNLKIKDIELNVFWDTKNESMSVEEINCENVPVKHLISNFIKYYYDKANF